jgi:hypothetical protein
MILGKRDFSMHLVEKLISKPGWIAANPFTKKPIAMITLTEGL